MTAPEAAPPPRARLLAAAVALLRASADGDISTREVCQAARANAPTLYHHFTDKDGLLQAAAHTGFEEYLRHKRARPSSGDALLDLRRGWDLHVEFGLANPSLYALMYDRPLRHRSSAAAVTARGELEAVVRGIEALGRLRVPIEVAVETLEAAAVGTTLQLVRHGRSSPDAAAVLVRDAVTAAVVRPGRAHDVVPAPQTADAAARLLEALPWGPLAGLRPTELAVLRDWLGDLAALAPAPVVDDDGAG